MDQREFPRPVSTTQVVGILTSTFALFFMVAFAIKSVDAYRLRNWNDRLETEINEMVRTRQELEEELKRRQSTAWVEEVLRDAGQLPAGAVRVVAVAATPNPVAKPTPLVVPTLPPTAQGSALFNNPHWHAWRRLILGFD